MIDYQVRFPVDDTVLSTLHALAFAAAAEAKAAGCEWLHVDYEPHLADFYGKACGFSPTEAALLKLR